MLVVDTNEIEMDEDMKSVPVMWSMKLTKHNQQDVHKGPEDPNNEAVTDKDLLSFQLMDCMDIFNSGIYCLIVH